MKVKLESEGMEIHAEWYRWIFNMKAGIKEKRWGILREKEERVKLRGEGRQGKEAGQQKKATCSERQSNLIDE